MGVTSFDAPQWFISSFVRSARGAGVTASEEAIRDVGQKLLECWAQPQRRFHNLRHLADVLGRVDELSQETHHPELVRLAAWYHGAVFAVHPGPVPSYQVGEDCTASAKLAVQQLAGLGMPADRARRVGELVNALARHAPDSGDVDSAVLSDADLAVLATEPQRYREYLREVREEYADISPADFVNTRIEILSRLLARHRLFSSPRAEMWEEAARQNIDAELQRLRKEQSKLAAASA